MISTASQLVSICLPVFNGSRHLTDAIESVLAQTYTNFELVISDDCSKDTSFNIIDEYAKRDSRIKVSRNAKNLGLFANYNKCLSLATGEFVKPFAQDDLLHTDALACAMDVFSSDPSIVLISLNQLLIDENSQVVQPIAKTQKSFLSSQSIEGTEILKQCLNSVKNEIGEPTTVMFRADCKGTGFDESFRHLGDLEYWLRILMHGSYFFIETPLCSFRLHENSATKTNKRLLLDSVELLRLGRLYGPALASMEGAKENFYKKAMTAIFSESAATVKKYNSTINSQGMNLSAEAKKLVAEVPSEEYFELALRILEKMHDENWRFSNVSLEGVKSDRADQIHELELEFSEYLNSRSWKISKHLREANKLLSPAECQDSFISSKVDEFEDQEVYETYLKNQIWRLKNSLSWRFTSPIRRIEKSLASRRTEKIAPRQRISNQAFE